MKNMFWKSLHLGVFANDSVILDTVKAHFVVVSVCSKGNAVNWTGVNKTFLSYMTTEERIAFIFTYVIIYSISLVGNIGVLVTVPKR